jgi:hypothetical protein
MDAGRGWKFDYDRTGIAYNELRIRHGSLRHAGS